MSVSFSLKQYLQRCIYSNFSTAKQNSNLYVIMGLCITTYYMCMLFIYFSSGCSLLKIINTMKKDRKPVEANGRTVAEIC